MSDRLKNTNNVSNEEIIEDLTKNLEYSLNSDVPKSAMDPGSSSDRSPESNREENNSSPVMPGADYLFEEDDKEKEDSSDEYSDEDSFTEESLKNVEVDLTDDDKAERQIASEEQKKIGNQAFLNGYYKQSIEHYTDGLRICPLQCTQQRAMLYCNRSAARMKLKRYKAAAKDCTKAIELDDKYLKAYFRRAQSYEAIESYDESLADFNKILELDPDHKEARVALVRLPPLIEQRNEKLKTEVLGKLKDLGNMMLRPFGLSTENFTMEKDPDSEGYKINFKR